MEQISNFIGDYGFLSNFYDSEIIDNDGIKYKTVEHYYQAQKTLDLNDQEKIRNSPSPGIAKKLGRKVVMRNDWDKVKIFIMEKALRMKFNQNLELKKKLIETNGYELIEGNWWHDTYWGVCNGKGQNHLGQLLMKLRNEYILGLTKF